MHVNAYGFDSIAFIPWMLGVRLFMMVFFSLLFSVNLFVCATAFDMCFVLLELRPAAKVRWNDKSKGKIKINNDFQEEKKSCIYIDTTYWIKHA